MKLLHNTVRRLRKQISTLGRDQVKTPQQLISKAADYLDPKILDFFKGQILSAVTSKSGRRYGVQERRFALAIYYHSPKTYRFLSSVFKLPSVSVLHSWLRNICIYAGWSKPSLAALKMRARALPKEETLCGIVFDAMSIKESLHYDRALDSILGREDFGEHATSMKEANHALVFMVKGLVRKWKIVFGHFFLCGSD